jgi:hypothetical protein
MSLWSAEMPAWRGLPDLLSQRPDRKIKRKNTPATIALVVALISTPLTYVRDRTL